jgi:hypothetical protein
MDEVRTLSKRQVNSSVEYQPIRGRCRASKGQPAAVVVIDSAYVTVPVVSEKSSPLSPEQPSQGVTYQIDNTLLWCGALFEEVDRMMRQRPGTIDGGTEVCFGGRSELVQSTPKGGEEPKVAGGGTGQNVKQLLTWVLPLVATSLICAFSHLYA